MNRSRLPETLAFADACGDDETTTIRVKEDWRLRSEAVPRVTIVKQASYSQVDASEDPEKAVPVVAAIEQAREERARDGKPPLHGIVFEGTSSYGQGNKAEMEALSVAAHSGIPVVRVGRAYPSGFIVPDERGYPTVEGGNLDANKARLLLTAALLKLGRLPGAADPEAPTDAETAAVMEKLAGFQDVFEAH